MELAAARRRAATRPAQLQGRLAASPHGHVRLFRVRARVRVRGRGRGRGRGRAREERLEDAREEGGFVLHLGHHPAERGVLVGVPG